jgi:hypothetical protein
MVYSTTIMSPTKEAAYGFTILILLLCCAFLAGKNQAQQPPLPLSITQPTVTTCRCVHPGYSQSPAQDSVRVVPDVKPRVLHQYIRGPRGGCYYINSNGNKVYVDRRFCD